MVDIIVSFCKIGNSFPLLGNSGKGFILMECERKETRLEVIEEGVRKFVKWNCRIEEYIQDEGRTLKLFIKSRQIKKEKNDAQDNSFLETQNITGEGIKIEQMPVGMDNHSADNKFEDLP